MILVTIPLVVRENQVWVTIGFDLFKLPLHRFPAVRQKPILELEHCEPRAGCILQEVARGTLCFFLSSGSRRENHPVPPGCLETPSGDGESSRHARSRCHQRGRQGKANAFPHWLWCEVGGSKTARAHFHTAQGVSPRAYISSNCCLSLKVSKHSQKPSYG